MAGVTVFCFWASYALVWGLELSRWLFRSRIQRVLLLGLAAAGLLAHTLFLAYSSTSESLPLQSLFHWLLVLAWVLAAVYLYLATWYRDLALGVFLLPVVLGLVAVAGLFVDRTPQPIHARLWVWLHGGLLVLGSAAVVAATVAGAMYLVQVWRLKRRRQPMPETRLPDLELLERINHKALTVAFALLTLGLGLGVVLALVRLGSQVWHLLAEPTVISAAAAWLVFAVLLHVRKSPRLRGRKSALLTIVSFVFLMLTLPVMLLLEQHAWH